MQEYHILKEGTPPGSFAETGEIVSTSADDACFRCIELSQDGSRYGFWVYESVNATHVSSPAEQAAGAGPTDPPVNVDVPVISQSASTLSCTMGNWDNEPTTYAYQWLLDGTDAGSNVANYAIQPTDVGKSATCVVTAANQQGSTTAPPSNAVVVA